MDAATLIALRNEPGSIGDTARVYATSFARIVTERTDEQDVFNNGLHLTLMYRAIALEKAGTIDGNLLLPLHIKGVSEIHRLLDAAEPDLDLPFRQDLPTMVLYAMLMESPSYRRGFAEMDSREILYPIGIIYEEIGKICPYQVRVIRNGFDLENAFLVRMFLFEADKSLKPIILRKSSGQ